MGAIKQTSELYYLHLPSGIELGPMSLAEVRMKLMQSGDPEPDYEVRRIGEERGIRASQFPELSNLFDADLVTAQQTKDETPSAKIRKANR